MSRVGVGIALTQKFYGAFVVDGMPPGGSASLSGEVHVGDIVRAIDGVELQGLSMDHAASLITGEVGSQALFTVERFGFRKQVLLTRRPLAPFRGPLFGIGLGLEPCPEGAAVKEIADQGAAHECGIFAKGDIVVAVNGQGVTGKTVPELRRIILGTFGSHIRISVARASEQPAGASSKVEEVEEISLSRGTGSTCRQVRSKEEAGELGGGGEETGEAQCAICCEEFRFESSECQAIALPCSHIFHAECVNEWLQRDDSCPTCKGRIPGVMNEADRPQGGWQAGQESAGWEWLHWEDVQRRRMWQYYDEPVCSIQ